jgi:hypothetical protein
MKKIISNYGLSITLFALFLVSWFGQYYFQWLTFVSEQLQHNQEPQIGEYINQFLTSTLENWQSEFLQLLTFVVLTSFLIHKGSHESKDSQDNMQKDINEIKTLLKNKK